MKAVKFLGQGRLSLVDAPDPRIDNDSVLIRIAASALCGSELHCFKDEDTHLGDKLNSGHEIVGTIIEAPPGCRYPVGTRVGGRIVQGCGHCRYCMVGDETACNDKRFFGGDGHAELFKLGIQGIHPLPDDADWVRGALLCGDGLGVPVRTARKLGDTAGKRVLVIGLGPIGLSCGLVQHFRGAHVMGADLAPYRLKLAQECGAEQVVDVSKEDVVQRVMDWTAGWGADVVILAVAREASLHLAFECVRRYGTVFQVAELEEAKLNFSKSFLRKEAQMMGSWYYTSADWPLMLQMHRDGLPYHKLITHTFPLAQAQEAFTRFAAGETGKVVLTVNTD